MAFIIPYAFRRRRKKIGDVYRFLTLSGLKWLRNEARTEIRIRKPATVIRMTIARTGLKPNLQTKFRFGI